MSIAEKFDNDPGHRPLTAEIAAWLAGLETDEISSEALTWAKHALLDWFGVTIAGANEPLVDILVDLYADGAGGTTVVGRGAKATMENAVLINGSTSHALDYDDVNGRLGGHPTVPVAPVVLALGEHLGARGRDILAAFVAGTEVECLIGDMGARGHYQQGFHATATIGTFGAASAASKLLGLNEKQIRNALGIAASQAAGLKSNFGTMTKPFHAGKAAMNGLMAARMAAKGFTANEAVIECAQGMADVMMPGFQAGFTAPNPAGYFAVQQTLFKYHAACYLTHASINAIGELRDKHGIGLDDLQAMTLQIDPGHLTVCNIPDPTTGLEIKFSIRHCAAMALAGMDTSALATYSDENAADARLAAARAKIDLETTTDVERHAARVLLTLRDGRTLEAHSDAGVPAADTDEQWTKLSAKFDSLCRPVIGGERADALKQGIVDLADASDIAGLMQAAS